MNNYTKINEMLHFSDIHPVDSRFILSYISELEKENNQLKEQYCERTDCSGRLGNSKKVEELIKENEKLNHYKLLYQKVKDRNDKAIEYIEENCWLSAMKEFNCLESGEVKYLVEILKGNNEE